MIPLIEIEIVSNNWIGIKEFGDIIAISQITPGPIAVNTATYVGARISGVSGALSATTGVSLPSFIIIVAIARVFIKFREYKIVEALLSGIKPVTTGMICSAVIFMAQSSIFKSEISFDLLKSLVSGNMPYFNNIIDLWSVIVFLIILISTIKFKTHPVAALALSALLGIGPVLVSSILSLL